MDYTIKFSAQFKEQLKALRKERGLSQAELGALVGVNQRRIADIEGNPGAVGLDQIMQILSALDAEMVVRDLKPVRLAAIEQTLLPARQPINVPWISARYLLATLDGRPSRSEAYLWRFDDPLATAPLGQRQRLDLLEQLARAMLASPTLLEANLQQAAKEHPVPRSGEETTPAIMVQWADALGVTPAALQQAVQTTMVERSAPPALNRAPAKGSW